MFRNYLTVGIRALAANPTYAALNIVGLAIGMAACLILLLFVRYEISFDRWLPGHENAYQVQTISLPRDSSPGEAMQMSAYVVGHSLAKDFPQIEAVSYAGLANPVILQDGKASTTVLLEVEAPFLSIIRLPLLHGDPPTALRNPNTMLLSEAEAIRRFGRSDILGKTLTLVRSGRERDYRITGVYRDIPKNSHIKTEMIVRFNPDDVASQPDQLTRYGWNSGYNYLRLRPGTDIAAIHAAMPAWEKRNIPDDNFGTVRTNEGDLQDWRLTPIADIHLGEAQAAAMTPGNDPRTIATFAIVALLILAMAAVNFTNLATARAGQRAREVALRKVLGASRGQLIAQFLGESILIATLAMLLGLALAELLLPLIADFLKADLTLSYLGPDGIALPILVLILLVGVAGGLYPALILSRFAPAATLKANRSASGPEGSGRLRQALVVAQFAVGIGLVICTGVIAAQTWHARSLDPGYNRGGLLQVDGMARKQIEPVAETLVNAVAAIPGVQGVGRTMIGVDTGSKINTSVQVPGRAEPIMIGSYGVDTGFFRTMGIRLIAGRGFDPNNARDDVQTPTPEVPALEQALAARGANVVVNALAAQRLGFATPAAAIGKTVKLALVRDIYGPVAVTIVGVVDDVRYRSIREPLEPIIFTYNRGFISTMVVRVDAARAAQVRDRIERVWRRYAPNVPFEAKFADDIVFDLYKAEQARATIFAAFAGLAIIVACLGLFGLAAFTAERRTKEIGIRKVLGARDRDIVRLLVWQFSRPVLLANLLAWPVAWWLMRGWLDSFNDRIPLGPHWFLGAGLLAALIAAATIITHALKVARASPINALRYE
ncbi:ABC transporter permease [Sandaracinobacteroides saxicola]|uniref:ABC transporter permease n=1 Tax=Sandaracinobacteroides saxicola TaxID=2759707 RepID=A0A7G5IEC5_9SPHN|nr:ABC transporter permease [Sandaracinobacteroides saxicola]QMW21717.1 ABC transporter permease [Sandaracinobacteroides saxicola]